ncbi:MAG: prepilin-type N-terminal cleavage/methylation domain-containing protein [Candidatus Paralactobacillus gallistercoris]|uniref:Prepilin-type N-terminal cleavage/methylation domain-containing protein n=1 Tax=Candidatus Paralactobacillus gallistercoris TaxID=2838724 RepID=A0A948TKE9_9LACO|nr:prepilin-type N-terminal cleavage/methylation domain-containing protein [Candidatus Paralactobacillus gallistercoris]
MRLRKLQGFTLLEMVVVIFIISLLILLILPNLTQQKHTAEAKTDAALASTIQTQIELYEDEEGTHAADKFTSFDELEKAKIITARQCKQAQRRGLKLKAGEVNS